LTGKVASLAPARWWQALTPAIYLVSILPGVGVWQLVRPTGEALPSLVAATLAVVLVQHAINVLNDVADWRLGADVEKWNSWVRVHGEDLVAATYHGWLSFLAGGLLGLATLAWGERLWVLAFALPLVGLGYLYNSGKRPLSYTRLGEWVTGLCYGPGVFGCLWLVTHQDIDFSTLMGCAAFGCLAVALLLSHQPPQIATDRQAGKQSFAARYGAARTYQTARALFLSFLITWGLALRYSQPHSMALALYIVLSCLVFAGTYVKEFGPKYLLLSSTALFAAQALFLPPIGP
jgi:1,4-dihydroxy-2-naphthoate octaprenyltransferase